MHTNTHTHTWLRTADYIWIRNGKGKWLSSHWKSKICVNNIQQQQQQLTIHLQQPMFHMNREMQDWFFLQKLSCFVVGFFYFTPIHVHLFIYLFVVCVFFFSLFSLGFYYHRFLLSVVGFSFSAKNTLEKRNTLMTKRNKIVR